MPTSTVAALIIQNVNSIQPPMGNTYKIKKGFNIPIAGGASETVSDGTSIVSYALIPSDFPGYTWKCAVKPGDTVLAGDPVMFAKECDEIKLVAPVCGTIEEIKRGERRKILYVSIKKTGEESRKFDTKESAEKLLKESGLFATFRQRPYDIVPDCTQQPRDIFVTAFDSAPLAPSLEQTPLLPYLAKGLEALKKLTSGKVYLSIPEGSNLEAAAGNAAEVNTFSGPHPAGNVGTQIAAIKPVNKGETVWTADIVSVCRFGKLMAEGVADFSCLVALTGPEINNRELVSTYAGAKLSELLAGHLDRESELRFISGNVLTGYKEELANGFLHFPWRQVTVIEEGDKRDEFMGWASVNPKKFSVSRAFPAFLRGFSKSKFDFDSRIKGGHRAMIMSGEYDKVFPMDIYPEFLIKAILAKNIEKMEERGIYEVAPEDFALPEFVDSSKLELQKIVREGLDYLRSETM